MRLNQAVPVDALQHYTEQARYALALEAVQELRNIALAERFNREHFDGDTSFADWAQSRCRALLAKLDELGEAT
jgi:hypothetical protein